MAFKGGQDLTTLALDNQKVAKHQLASQQSRARSVTIPKTMHQRATTYHENGTTKQHGAPTLVKTEQLLLSPGGYNPTAEQNNYLQHNQEQQLANINVQAVNWRINLKYYPGLGEVTFQSQCNSCQQLIRF